jgi:hypothetical protein
MEGADDAKFYMSSFEEIKEKDQAMEDWNKHV